MPVEGFRAFAELLAAIGHSADVEALAGYLAEDEQQEAEIGDLLSRAARGAVNGQEVPVAVASRMQGLTGALSEELCRMVAELPGAEGAPTDLAELRKFLQSRSQGDLDELADYVLLGEHGRLVERPYGSSMQFREVLEARGDAGKLALVKLVPFLRQEAAKRGFVISNAEIRELFEPGLTERRIPRCLARVLSGVNGEFDTGLISMAEMVGDEDPDQWLEAVRQKLQFRSHSAMHKAIAEATTLKYDCVHKALSGRSKAKRIQAEIKYCIDQWLEDLAADREPEIDDDHRGVPVAQMHALMPQLERKFRTKEEIYRLISEKTGIKTGSVRRYFQDNGQLKYAPLSVYDWARKLATENGDKHARHDSYLSDRLTRRAAQVLAQKASEALNRWRDSDEDPELEIEFKELRRALIM
ncbi:MAG: hypothetical protein ACYTFZ_09375, partial [Planctomycetota bacterium]